MNVYLDTAFVEQWEALAGFPPLQGVTTNPSLILQAGLPVTLDSYVYLIEQAQAHELPELMLQLPRNDVSEACHWLDHLISVAGRTGVTLTIKLPCHPNWLPVIAKVKERRLAFLLTGLSNPIQLLWARAQGADFVAPYLGRLKSDGRDVDALVRACVAVQGDGVKLLAASIKSAEVFCSLVAAGAYAATVRPDFIRELATDPLTDMAIADFDRDVALSLKPRG